jgi:G6PDH family F420-dependent oxidoreductase
MLEEAVAVMRRLWTGEVVSHRGRHYTVDTARVYTVPDEPPQVLVSAFGPKAMETATRIGDGFITTAPDADGVAAFRAALGDDVPTVAGLKVAYAGSREEGVEHAHRLCSIAGLPGELAQVLPSPQHFEQASSLVTKEATAKSVVAGDDAEEHVRAFEPYAEAGFGEVFVANMGPHYREMIEFYGREVLPSVGGRAAA